MFQHMRIPIFHLIMQGLGKTITALALVLRTKGSVPRPPPNTFVTVAPDKDGNRAAFYSLPAHDPMVRKHFSEHTWLLTCKIHTASFVFQRSVVANLNMHFVPGAVACSQLLVLGSTLTDSFAGEGILCRLHAPLPTDFGRQ